jgi:uncharacterized protein YukE
VINLPGLAELQRLSGTLEAALSKVLSLGEPGLLAGDPATIRALASAHRRAANVLRTVQDDGQSWAAGVAGGALWEGTASDAFTGYWADVHGRVGEVASNHDRMASSLESIAEESARFNSDAMATVGGIRSWLAAAPAAVLRMDPGEIAGLLRQGGTLISDMERLLGDVEQFADRIVQGMSIDLAFTRRQINKMTAQPLGRGIIKDPIPPRQNPREIIPIPDLKPQPNVMGIGEVGSGLLITTLGDIPGLSNILKDDPGDVLQPGGQPIGRPGSAPRIREAPGGKPAAEAIWKRLKGGGADVTPPNYPGQMVEYPDGSRYGYRPVSGSGDPTIDVNDPNMPNVTKIHFPSGF